MTLRKVTSASTALAELYFLYMCNELLIKINKFWNSPRLFSLEGQSWGAITLIYFHQVFFFFSPPCSFLSVQVHNLVRSLKPPVIFPPRLSIKQEDLLHSPLSGFVKKDWHSPSTSGFILKNQTKMQQCPKTKNLAVSIQSSILQDSLKHQNHFRRKNLFFLQSCSQWPCKHLYQKIRHSLQDMQNLKLA